ncbi:MAG TPA: UDP-3-O-(3-hydroxymyristoyl)glucosamine N-acyltransferase [Planktothrix sp.]|jgi:UDP-3-O-[3-hydroxymyristoyl] glucosamine N-acyltransferase
MKLPSEMTSGQIAQLIGGRTHGDPNIKVSSVAMSPLEAGEGQIAFIYEEKLVKRLPDCKASVVIVPEGTEADRPLIIVKRAPLALSKVLHALAPKRYTPDKGVHPTAVVHPTAEIGENVAIGPLCVIGAKTKIGARTRIAAGVLIGGEVTIGDECFLNQGVRIADYVKIGNKVVLQQGASIGADGFGYVTERPSNMELKIAGAKADQMSDEPNPLLKIPQIGTVIIEDEVEIGSNSTIDRATMGATVIGKGTKIDNLVMIAHNVRIGRECIIVAGTGVAGSCTIGDRAVLAGYVSVNDHVRIGKDSIAEGCASVMENIPDGEAHVGTPAQPHAPWWKQQAIIRKLPQMRSDVKALEKRIAQLEQQLLERQLIKG